MAALLTSDDLTEVVVDHVARLDKLPEGLEFPLNLKDRIHYAAEKRRLVFRGFMAKSQFDSLARLSDDLAYQRAVDELFRLSTESDDRSALWHSTHWHGRTLAATVSLCLVLGGFLWWLLVSDSTGTAAEETKQQSTSRVEATARVQE